MTDLTVPVAVTPVQPAAGTAAAPGIADLARDRRRGRARILLLDWLIVTVPALAEVLAGGYQLSRPSLWRDEGYTRSAIQRPVGDLIAMLANQDAVHGLYYLVMHLFIVAAGTSVGALRLPSLIASSLAAALTAALGRRLARAAGLPLASLTGLIAGLLLVTLPLTTWYAQDSRPYAMATLSAVGATYLFVRGIAGTSRWWWAGYALTITVLAMLNLLALLLVAAHGISVLIVRRRAASPGPVLAPRVLTGRWLVASAAATVTLGPLIVFTARQASQLNWVRPPGLETVIVLIAGFAGYGKLIPLVAPLAILGFAADLGRQPGAGWSPAAVTVPWLVLPPVVLLAVSEAEPVFVERYVIFCLPAMALITAGGMTWLGRQAWLTAAGRRCPALASLPPALLLIVIAALLAGPQQLIRTNSARPDNLALVAAVVAARARPGDVIFYMPWNARVVALAYPGPFRDLRDVGLGESGITSATLGGVPASASALASRFTRVRRVWTVRWANLMNRPWHTPLAREQARLLGRLVQVRQWRIKTMVLTLYAARRYPRWPAPRRVVARSDSANSLRVR